jgi:hypothetical protein
MIYFTDSLIFIDIIAYKLLSHYLYTTRFSYFSFTVLFHYR